MGKPASQREEDYRREVLQHLEAVAKKCGWSQSEMARQIGVISTTINKAIKLKHSLGLEKLLVLEERSGVKIPESLLIAAKARHSAAEFAESDAQAFLDSSPDWQKLVQLGAQLKVEANPKARAKLQREIQELAAKVA